MQGQKSVNLSSSTDSSFQRANTGTQISTLLALLAIARHQTWPRNRPDWTQTRNQPNAHKTGRKSITLPKAFLVLPGTLPYQSPFKSWIFPTQLNALPIAQPGPLGLRA